VAPKKQIATQVNNPTPSQRYIFLDFQFRRRMMPKPVRRVGPKASGVEQVMATEQ